MLRRLAFLPVRPVPLECIAERPAALPGGCQRARRSLQTMDAFSEVLSGVRLKGAVFFRAAFTAPWDFTSPPSHQFAPLLAPGAKHLIVYHLVAAGTLRAGVLGGPVHELRPGDIVAFPHGDAHTLGGGSGPAPVDEAAVMRKISSRDLSPLSLGGGGETTELVCGFLACDPVLCGPILQGLPPILRVHVRSDRAGQWLEQSIVHLADEAAAHRPGSDAMLAKLSEALFVDTLRRHVAGLPESATGWLAGARDAAVGRALALLHHRPHHAWTIAELGDAVGMSRSVLVERFSRYLGEPPMAYLTGWRLRLAADALATTSRGVADIAADVGYESEAAFNRAFKRTMGRPPAAFRREQRAKEPRA
jgi:AraC-like DNA-binding protein